MIQLRAMPNDGFVEISFSPDATAMYGATLSFSTDGGTSFKPCALYYGIDADSLTDAVFSELWNSAINEGKLLFSGTAGKVYWNLFLNQLHTYAGSVRLRAEILTARGVKHHEADLELTPSAAAFFTDWASAVSQTSGWKIEDGSLTRDKEAKESSVLAVKPGLTGRFRVLFGVPHGTFLAWLKMSDEPNRYPLLAQKFHAEFYHKGKKEIPWKTVALTPDSVLEIRTVPHALRNPDLYPFGKVSYIKFAPESRPAKPTKPHWADKKLALYFEPYSWSFLYNLDEPWQVKEAMSLFREMGADEIHNQLTRFGSRALHHSRVAERYEGATVGDDQSFSEGPARMVRNLDILRETYACCKELGMHHYANAGLTICYCGEDLEEKISREHPEWRTDNFLRYTHPETRAYAAGIVREFVEWGTDGVSIDCMRYPWLKTEEELLLFFHEIRGAMGKDVPLTVRIPAADTVYFAVCERLAREGVIQCVIPSSDAQAVKFSLAPYLKWKDYGCRVYGRVDGWLTGLWWDKRTGFSSLFSSPREIREDIRRFLTEGADGIFVYQADSHLADPLTRTAIDWRKW